MFIKIAKKLLKFIDFLMFLYFMFFIASAFVFGLFYVGENQYGILLLVLFIISLLWVLSDALQDYVQSYIKE